MSEDNLEKKRKKYLFPERAELDNIFAQLSELWNPVKDGDAAKDILDDAIKDLIDLRLKIRRFSE